MVRILIVGFRMIALDIDWLTSMYKARLEK